MRRADKRGTHYFAFAVDKIRSRKAGDFQNIIQTIDRHQVEIIDPVLLDQGFAPVGIRIRISTDADHSHILIRKAVVHLSETRQFTHTVPAPCSPDIDHSDFVLCEDFLALYGISVHICRFELKSLADQARPGNDRGEKLGAFQGLNKVVVQLMVFFRVFRLDIGCQTIEELRAVENIVRQIVHFANLSKLLFLKFEIGESAYDLRCSAPFVDVENIYELAHSFTNYSCSFRIITVHHSVERIFRHCSVIIGQSIDPRFKLAPFPGIENTRGVREFFRIMHGHAEFLIGVGVIFFLSGVVRRLSCFCCSPFSFCRGRLSFCCRLRRLCCGLGCFLLFLCTVSLLLRFVTVAGGRS